MKFVDMPLLKKVASEGFANCNNIETINIPENIEAEYNSFSPIAAENNSVIQELQQNLINSHRMQKKMIRLLYLKLARVYMTGQYEV